MFAKLFETELGQILVKIDNEGDDPEVRYFFEPEGLGVCSMALGFTDDDEKSAWDKAEYAFEQTTADVAVSMIKKIIDRLSSVKQEEDSDD